MSATAASAESKDTPEQAEFRAYCREWLENNHPGKPTVQLPQGALLRAPSHAPSSKLFLGERMDVYNHNIMKFCSCPTALASITPRIHSSVL